MERHRPDNDTAGNAPLPLRWIEEFVNTRRADRDDIATPDQLTAWLRTRDLLTAGVTATARQRDRAESVREGLRALLAENNAGPVASPHPDGLDPTARSTFAALSRDLPLILDVNLDPPRLVPAAADPVDAALTALLGYVADSVATGTWSRLKTCREPSCRWAYYDHSRNHRRTWCSMDLCGNRAKARGFHHRAATSS